MSETIKQAFNRSPLNSLAPLLAAIGFGDVLRGLRTTLRMQAGAASAVQLATLVSFALPADAKASKISRAYARVAGGGGGTIGELSVQAYGATPATGQIAVAPNGDIVLLAADLYSQVDVIYEPELYDVVTLTNQPCAAAIYTIPAQYTALGVAGLIAATIDAGTLPGSKIVLVPGAAPATTKVNLNAAKTQVLFAVADAPTTCDVTLMVAKKVDANAVLEAVNNTFV